MWDLEMLASTELWYTCEPKESISLQWWRPWGGPWGSCSFPLSIPTALPSGGLHPSHLDYGGLRSTPNPSLSSLLHSCHRTARFVVLDTALVTPLCPNQIFSGSQWPQTKVQSLYRALLSLPATEPKHHTHQSASPLTHLYPTALQAAGGRRLNKVLKSREHIVTSIFNEVYSKRANPYMAFIMQQAVLQKLHRDPVSQTSTPGP